MKSFPHCILDAGENIYSEKLGQALRIAAEAKKPLHFLAYTMLEFVDNDPDYDLNQPCGQ